ncbi:hypothetical protein BGP77_01815 [Saccharospirillum sp. MSK14-1]|uniref:hypothetical protein n=1 Tax=Saccharospirillum sp. MSK14-1 TaxID=1897632 RepID=UPI000D38FBD6|nr:hypothetical protein [Saccharospirillum sp. MSK14-1]PTY36079.1 hypothetical protein BGP77_01815 [Saccharospirillum sp. MSK14-1]
MNTRNVGRFLGVLAGGFAIFVGLMTVYISALWNLGLLIGYLNSYRYLMSYAEIGWYFGIPFMMRPWCLLFGFFLVHRGYRKVRGRGWWAAGKYGPRYIPDLRYPLATFVIGLSLQMLRAFFIE